MKHHNLPVESAKTLDTILGIPTKDIVSEADESVKTVKQPCCTNDHKENEIK